MSDYDEAKAYGVQGCGFLGIGCLAVIALPVFLLIIGGIVAVFS